MRVGEVLSKRNRQLVEQAVAAAEKRTTAEIKVVLARFCWGDLTEKARRLFHKHRLHETRDRNAVMILLVRANREFLVYGDRGIDDRVADDFWTMVRDAMQQEFAEGRIAEGLCAGVAMIGEQLAAHYPPDSDDVNEIPDGVIHDM